MQKRSGFLQISMLLMIAALVVLAAVSGQRVQAGVPAQETEEATETAAPTDSTAATAAPTTEGTVEGTAEVTATPTIGGDEAYPPCPARPVQATDEATQAATDNTATGGADSAATTEATGEATDTATDAATGAATDTAASAATPMPSATVVATTEATEAVAATAEGTAASPTIAATTAVEIAAFENTNGCVLMASLAGANEVPNPGDPDAAGTAMLIITRPETGAGQVCFRIETSGLTLPATGAHIHAGPAGIAGKIVVPLKAPGEDGKADGCAKGVDRSLLKAILLYPDSYYVNVHTSDFQGGAIRGQLVGQ